MADKPVQKISVSEQVYQYLKDEIINNRLAPHTKINIIKLSEELGISRMPVNAALARLQNDGYVTILPQSGTYVRELSEEELEVSFRCRAGMEREILLAYGSRLDRDKLAEFQEQFQAIYQASGCTAEILERNFALDVSFHAFVVQNCPEIILREILNIMDLTKRSRILQIQRIIREQRTERYQQEIKIHLDIVDAILRGDLSQAGDLLYRDIMDTYQTSVRQ